MEVVGIIIGLDVHKHSIYATELNEDGNINEQYEMANSEDCWNEFKDRYIRQKPEIALEVSTSGKYVTRLLRDMGFSVHMADPSKLIHTNLPELFTLEHCQRYIFPQQRLMILTGLTERRSLHHMQALHQDRISQVAET